MKEISGFIPTETQIAQSVSVAVMTYITWLMVKTIRDQNKYQAKKRNKKKDSDDDAGKSFDDIGGCSAAKKAITEIIDFLKSPEKY